MALIRSWCAVKGSRSSTCLPVLDRLHPGQLSGPLSQFQANQVSFDGTLKIVSALNRMLGPVQMPDADLAETFEVWWPKLEEKVQNTPIVRDTTQRRSHDDMLEEIISNTREQIRRENLRIVLQREEVGKIDQATEMMQNFSVSMQGFMTNVSALERNRR
jgi:hypothetical protein